MPNKKLGRLILLRHGESIWNRNDPKLGMEIRFTGWSDIPLSERGKQQAKAAGKCLYQFNLHNFDIVFTSLLERSTITYDILSNQILKESINNQVSRKSSFKNPPIIESWRLNERHYGALIGLSKGEAERQFGKDQVRAWRRSWDVVPPPMLQNPYFYSIANNKVSNEPMFDWQSEIWYKAMTRIRVNNQDPVIEIEDDANIPLSESIKDCTDRVLPLWEGRIVPKVLSGENVLVVAHSNTIRGLVKHIDRQTLSDENLKQVLVPSAIPMIYTFDRDIENANSIVPNGKLSHVGVSGRFIVNEEVLELSLAANQNLEMSENLDHHKDTMKFKNLLKEALNNLENSTSQVYVTESDVFSNNNDICDMFRKEICDPHIMEPGWMNIPIHEEKSTN